MRIADIRFGMLTVPLKTPFKTALRTVDKIEDVVVTVETDDGHVGYGSAPATAVITGDTHASIIAAINTVIGPAISGHEIEDLNLIVGKIQSSLVNNSSAKAAVEMAIFDLFGQLHNSPLYKVLGGGTQALSTDITISLNDTEKMTEDVMAALAMGFESLKIKVGRESAVDINRIKTIYDVVANRASLRLDANQGWNPKQAVSILRTLEASGVRLELVEQPVIGSDIDGLRYVTERIQTPVMADESCFGPKEAIEIIKTRAADILNIKLMKAGGISKALMIADIAHTFGVECMMGCMLESSIGACAAAHLAASRSSVITKIDLDTPALGQSDPVTSGVGFDNAKITMSDAPGLGITRIDNLMPLEIEPRFGFSSG